jgi:hypothetical protein
LECAPHSSPYPLSLADKGLLRATVLRHFLGFLALRETSRRFIRANCKLAVVKAIAAFKVQLQVLVERKIRIFLESTSVVINPEQIIEVLP